MQSKLKNSICMNLSWKKDLAWFWWLKKTEIAYLNVLKVQFRVWNRLLPFQQGCEIGPDWPCRWWQGPRPRRRWNDRCQSSQAMWLASSSNTSLVHFSCPMNRRRRHQLHLRRGHAWHSTWHFSLLRSNELSSSGEVCQLESKAKLCHFRCLKKGLLL